MGEVLHDFKKKKKKENISTKTMVFFILQYYCIIRFTEHKYKEQLLN